MNRELKAYSEELSKKPQILALNKIDITEVREDIGKIEKHFSKSGVKTFPISSATGEGTKELVWEVVRHLENLNKEEI